MINNLQDFEKLPQQAKYTLWFLRGLRDAIVNGILSWTDDEELHAELEKLCGYQRAAPSWLRGRLTASLLAECDKEKFDLLWFLCRRIAYLERQGCRAYINTDLADAI